MQSANDAPERDPRVITLEGSNDDTITAFDAGTWELIVQLSNIPDFTARFQTQEFYFPNKKSYKHYRWTVLETATPNTCCFQIAEVELLAVSEGADCSKAKFLVQPTDTPVLEGAQATLITTVNGPWPLQWFKNGAPIPGATATTYTTDPVTSENATNVYSVQIVGCEMSAEVKAVIFNPSATKSVGISFIGGGANGAPTSMNTNDIAGLHPQAYWNNLSGGSGTSSELVDSDNNPSTLTFEWATSGQWGAGTGDGSPLQRMLNGLNYANPGSTATLTFYNVPAGKHTVIAYLVGIPLQFQDANYTITAQSSETFYVRVINADEYNAAPGFYRGMSKDPNKRDLATFVRFDNVSPDASTMVTLTYDCLTTGFDRGVPVNAIQLILNSTPAGAPPLITLDPQPTVGPAGRTVTLSVSATGDNLTYQWLKNGRNLPNGGNISGATTATLSIGSFSEADEGVYNVAVFNAGGSVVSKNAAVSVSKYDIKDALVGYWKFDETSGATAANSATGGKPGQVNGTGAWVAGQVGNALGFDGVTTYVMVDDYTKATKAVSASGWVKVDANAATPMTFIRNGLGTFRRPTSGNPVPVGQFELGLLQDQADFTFRLTAGIQVGPNLPAATASSPFNLGSWQHVAFSADGAQLRLYLNGVQIAYTDYLGPINPPDMKFLSIGSMMNTNDVFEVVLDPITPNLMIGQIDELAVWKRALTASEVSKIYAAGRQAQALTTVKLEPPAVEPGTLSISAAEGKVTVTWDKGKLQTAPAVTGPWSDSTASSPLTEPASDKAKFYRTVSQ
jgi:hypothetical protein